MYENTTSTIPKKESEKKKREGRNKMVYLNKHGNNQKDTTENSWQQGMEGKNQCGTTYLYDRWHEH